jgi:PDZ domain-containing protein
MSRRGLTFFLAALLVAGLAVLANVLPVPYVVFVPGPLTDTLHDVNVVGGPNNGQLVPVVSVSGARTYPVSGHLFLTTVGVVPGDCSSHPTLYQALKAWWNKTQAVEPQQVYCQPGESSKDLERQNAQEMTDSQQDAITAALLHLGYKPTTEQITVGSTTPGLPADGVLEPGDVLVAVDGQKVTSAASLKQLVSAHPIGTAIDVTIERGAKRHVERLTTADDGAGGAVIGVTPDLRATFTKPKVHIGISPDQVGGPSAGLAFTLGIIDKLTPGSLTGGRTIAGTGTIDGFGHVGEIGGIQQKIAGAVARGATVFLAPAGDCADAKAVAPKSLTLVRVDTLDTALAALQAITSGTGTFPRC